MRRVLQQRRKRFSASRHVLAGDRDSFGSSDAAGGRGNPRLGISDGALSFGDRGPRGVVCNPEWLDPLFLRLQRSTGSIDFSSIFPTQLIGTRVAAVEQTGNAPF